MQIAIIGLGLIGGSLGLALKKNRWQELEIVGYAHHAETASQALKLRVVDKTKPNLESAVKEANLVVIATPILTVREIFSQIATYLPPDCVVTDVGSTKLKVMEWAETFLPKTVSFIGGHPMAGKEIFGITAAEADLFQGCTYCLTPAPNVTPEAVKMMVNVVTKIGATPFFIDAQEHDNLVAAVSHLLILLSSALVSMATKSPSWSKMAHLAATGYRDLTRLASGNPKVNADICSTNQEAILYWIDKFIEELKIYRHLVTSNNKEIEKALARANKARQNWLQQKKC